MTRQVPTRLVRRRADFVDRRRPTTKARPFRCAHCGEPCGKAGHLTRHQVVFDAGHRAVDAGWCPTVGAARVTEGGEVQMGFACAPGHTCLTVGPIRDDRPVTMGARPPHFPRVWRDDPPTAKQLEYLLVLGYGGPRPATKGQAHDLLDRLHRGEEVDDLERSAATRGIHLRPERPDHTEGD